MSTEENPVPLQMRVNLVPVRVVVRDADGAAVSSLHRDDFQLFEDGKPQIISNFTVETLNPLSKGVPHPETAASGAGAPTPAFAAPSRFVALLFDDPRLTLQDLMQARNAANRFIDSSLAPVDRVAVFTVSGQTQSDFTDDRAKLHSILAGLLPREVTAGDSNAPNDCPPMDYYEAELIQNKHDQQTIDVATQDALACMDTSSSPVQPTAQQLAAMAQEAQTQAENEALRLEEFGDEQTGYSLRRLREVVERMSALPGNRSIVFISPGFIYPNRQREFSELVDRAIRANVFINSLDARGLYTPDLGDISQTTNDMDPVTKGYRLNLHLAGESAQLQVLLDLADDTGGFAFHSSNDLEGGLHQLVSAPETYYLLAFVPQNLKFDGSFHSIRVSLAGKQKFAIQARKGFYAPQHGETPAEAAARDIQDAVFSQEEQHGLPVALQTQYFKTDATDAKLSVLARVDLAHIHFDKADGRNLDDLTIVAALFDRNGNFITGTQKLITMKLRDDTLAKLSQTGVTVRTSFDVKPGDYVVRLVVRDSKSELLSAENGAVQIPF